MGLILPGTIVEYRFVSLDFQGTGILLDPPGGVDLTRRPWTRLVPDEAQPKPDPHGRRRTVPAWPQDLDGPVVFVHPTVIEKFADMLSRDHMRELAYGHNDRALRAARCMRSPDQPLLARVVVF